MAKKDAIMMQEVKSSIAKEKDDFIFLLDLLNNTNNAGLLHDIVNACGKDTSLAVAVSSLISKLNQARNNVIPELDNLIKLIDDNMPKPDLAPNKENSNQATDQI